MESSDEFIKFITSLSNMYTKDLKKLGTPYLQLKDNIKNTLKFSSTIDTGWIIRNCKPASFFMCD